MQLRLKQHKFHSCQYIENSKKLLSFLGVFYCSSLVGLGGIEPPPYPPHGHILPLYYSPIFCCVLYTRDLIFLTETVQLLDFLYHFAHKNSQKVLREQAHQNGTLTTRSPHGHILPLYYSPNIFRTLGAYHSWYFTHNEFLSAKVFTDLTPDNSLPEQILPPELLLQFENTVYFRLSSSVLQDNPCGGILSLFWMRQTSLLECLVHW